MGDIRIAPGLTVAITEVSAESIGCPLAQIIDRQSRDSSSDFNEGLTLISEHQTGVPGVSVMVRGVGADSPSTQPIPDVASVGQIMITRAQVDAVMQRWMQDERAGRTRPQAIVDLLPAEEVAAESAAYLWAQLVSSAQPATAESQG